LETGCPHELHIEAVADWPDEEERRLHRYLEASFVRGEWFEDGARVQGLIKLMQDPNGLDAWRTICEHLGWRQPEKPKRGEKTKFDPRPEPKTPEEIRREERKEWWKRNEHSLSQHQGST